MLCLVEADIGAMQYVSEFVLSSLLVEQRRRMKGVARNVGFEVSLMRKGGTKFHWLASARVSVSIQRTDGTNERSQIFATTEDPSCSGVQRHHCERKTPRRSGTIFPKHGKTQILLSPAGLCKSAP